MNNTETLLLAIAIIILLGLIIYSLLLSSGSLNPKSAESQAESLKKLLDEYALQVKKEEKTLEEQFDSLEITIPTKIYPKFDNSRAVDEMGLSQEDADAFVLDLIKAIEAEVPKIDMALTNGDYKSLEEIVHTITGTSSTLGSGGISSALISFYAAVQHHDSLQKLFIHQQNVKHYLSSLKEEYVVV
ncbi:hypothetical protein [Sulfurimonas sp. HSL3-7]|uniref:hypothetical protein n=1 Tax=Sulfonitrofixus jiaomeiensis TaxID=3131938 RepID=UPI0031F934D9